MLTFLSKGTNINNILMAISLFRRVKQSVLGGSTHTVQDGPYTGILTNWPFATMGYMI